MSQRVRVNGRMLLLLGLLALPLWLSGGGEDAYAFERSVTCGPPPNPFACSEGQSSAFVNWPSRCITLYINDNASKAIDLTAMISLTEAALEVWNTPDCSDFTMSYAGVTSDSRVGYYQEEQNANILLFRDTGWTHGRGVLALTSVTYDVQNGTIVDADIEFNSQQYNFTNTDNAALVDIDIANTLVHELGHFLGLDHSSIDDSTMFASAPRGETKKRTLHEDDIQGLCAIYPTTNAVCPAVVPGVFRPSPASSDDDGCSVSRESFKTQRTQSVWGILLALAGVMALRARRGRASTHKTPPA